MLEAKAFSQDERNRVRSIERSRNEDDPKTTVVYEYRRIPFKDLLSLYQSSMRFKYFVLFHYGEMRKREVFTRAIVEARLRHGLSALD